MSATPRRATPPAPTLTSPTTRRSPSVAAALSFVFPGLGQAYAGDRRSAAAQSLPPALMLVALAVVALVIGPVVLLVHLLNPTVALVAGVLVIALGLWRIVSIVHASRVAATARGADRRAPDRHAADSDYVLDADHDPYPDPRSEARRQRRGPATAVVVLLVALVVLMHGWAGAVVWSTYQAGQRIAQPLEPSSSPTPTAQPTSATGGTAPPPSTTPPSAAPSPSVAPSPLPGGRVTILFMGRDLGRGSEGHLTDSLQVASFDPRSGQIVIISVPRDTGQLPLYNGGVWNQKINALMSYAEAHPDEFPDGGMATLRRQLEYILGVPIHYHASVDFAGFVRLVDMVGGVDVTLDRPIADATYWHQGRQIGFFMEPGEHHLDGVTALAYVRSRHGPGNSDFQRARRQQQVLLAVRHKIDDPDVLANLPAIIDAASQMVRTDVPLDRLPEIVALLQASTDADTDTYVLQPRTYAEVIPRSEIGNVYMTRLKMDAVADLSISLFGEESRYFGLDE